MAEPLAIWLYGSQIALIERERNDRLRLSYTEEALATYDAGTPLLSLALPLTTDRYPNGVTRAFLEGLLPEGESRRKIAEDLGLVASDTFGLLAALGKDCAGALVIQTRGEPRPSMTSTRTAEPLTDDGLANLVANLRNAPLGIDRDVRVSLAGVQQKLLLTRMPDGRWGRPVGGTPSTHILKPEIERFQNTIENEAFCMRVARRLGLAVAGVDTIIVDDRQVLVVERYDRIVDHDGTVERVHQEDFCQAFGLPPNKKYEDEGGPSLARIAGTLQEVAERAAPDTLLRAVTLNLAIGNCDAHGKNWSLLHDRSGHIRLAPLYDLMSTRLYPIDDTLAMYVDGVQKADRVTADRIVNEASRWPIAKSRAREIVMDCLDRLPAAVEAAAADTDDIPPELTELVERRIGQLRV